MTRGILKYTLKDNKCVLGGQYFFFFMWGSNHALLYEQIISLYSEVICLSPLLRFIHKFLMPVCPNRNIYVF